MNQRQGFTSLHLSIAEYGGGLPSASPKLHFRHASSGAPRAVMLSQVTLSDQHMVPLLANRRDKHARSLRPSSGHFGTRHTRHGSAVARLTTSFERAGGRPSNVVAVMPTRQRHTERIISDRFATTLVYCCGLTGRGL